MDVEAEVRPAIPSTSGRTLETAVEHPFVVPSSEAGPSRESTSQLANGDQQSPTDSTSTTTLPRLASFHGSHSGSRSGVENFGVNEHPAAVTEPEAESTRRSSSSFTGNVLRGDSIADQEVIVLTPSRLRLDSRVVFAHATLQWLTNAIWAVLIWQKLEGRLNCSWWVVFSPTVVNHVLHIPMQLIVLHLANYMIYKQIGPPPPPSATPGLVLQYAILQHVRIRSHRVDWANNALESLAIFVVKMLFCDALHRDTLASTPLRLMFTPIWACWAITFVLLCFKDRTERMFGSSRDLFFIFLLFVAFKVDDQSSYSWRVVFLVPWMWFSGLMLVAAMVFLLLLFARVWARPRELLLPIGFLLLLLSSVPQFVSYIALVRRLDNDTGTSIASIMWPNALSWFLMWLSAGVIAAALRQKEAVRDALLARGAVWTAYERVARQLHPEREEAQRRVDEMTEEEIARHVESLMAGKSKPGRLRRVGENLYKRIASLEPALAEQAAQGALAAAGAGAGSALASPTGSTTAASATGAAGLPSPSGQDPGGVESAPSPPLSPAGAAGLGRGDSFLQPRSVSGSGAGGTRSAAASGAAGGLGLFRNNRVVPLGPRAAVAQAGPVGAAPGAEAGGAAAVSAAGSPRGVEGSSGAAGVVAAGAAAAVAPVAAAGGAVGAESGALASRGPVPILAPAPTIRAPSSRTNSWLARAAAPGAAGGGSSGAAVELATLEEGRDVESGVGSSLPALAEDPSLSRPASRTQPQAKGPQDPLSRRPSETDSLGGNGGVDATSGAAGPAAAAGQRRGRPGQLPPRQRPASAASASAAGAPVAAAAETRGTEASLVAGTSGSGRAAAAAQRPLSASTSMVAGTSRRTAAATGPGPRRAPSLTEEGAVASPRSTAGGAGAGAGEMEAAAAAASVPRPSGSVSGSGAAGGGEQPRPSDSPAVAGQVVASSTSFARRSPAVLPTAEADLQGPQAVGPGASGQAGPAADAADAAGPSADEGAAAGDAPASPVSSEREDVANVRPVAPDSHTPRLEGSVELAGAVTGGGGGAAAAIAAAAAGADDDIDPDSACIICYAEEATCVFLECGHGGFCRRCAYLQFVRPPNECPICRAVIDQVVEIEPVAAVGEVARVK